MVSFGNGSYLWEQNDHLVDSSNHFIDETLDSFKGISKITDQLNRGKTRGRMVTHELNSDSLVALKRS